MKVQPFVLVPSLGHSSGANLTNNLKLEGDAVKALQGLLGDHTVLISACEMLIAWMECGLNKNAKCESASGTMTYPDEDPCSLHQDDYF